MGKIKVERPTPTAGSAMREAYKQTMERIANDGTMDKAAKLLSAAYLTYTTANAYFEAANDLLEPYGLMRGKLKTAANNMMQSFDAYDKVMQGIINGNEGALRQLCFDSEILRELLDAFLQNNIEVQRGQYYQPKLFLPIKNQYDGILQ